ncbi:hypothetical protein QOZ80_8BG0669000 [Eleusine coracana subsp. coracana]|nr:hypothetical protein QOZ80_8BG0669000 [Eleusine coracana subsp. coracana]
MEVEVRVVGGARSCFVALPLHLIHTLERTSASGDLPPVLALDLRTAAGGRWSLAWSGAASRSRAIEVAQELAECISLPDGTIAQLSVARSLAKADSVSIEPFSEDDWEILESRADLAEETILKQVGIIYEGMKFPLWLDGHNIVKFVVVSSCPAKTVVQLMPGTEVAVAPKNRKEKSSHDVQKQTPLKEQVKTKALLRVQAAVAKYAHTFRYKGVDIGVVLSNAVLIHPETATSISFGNLQLVTVSPKSSKRGLAPNGKEVAQKKGISVAKERSQEVVVYILLSDTVAKGHVMLPYSIRHFISADVHSWVYVKSYSANIKKDEPVVTISPLRFKVHAKDGLNSTKFAIPETDASRISQVPLENGDFFQESHYGKNEDLQGADVESISESMLKHKFFIKQWLLGQLKEMALHSHTEISTVVLPTEVLLHFEAIDQKLNRGVEFLYLLSVASENSGFTDSQFDIEIAWSVPRDSPETLELYFGKLELGETVSFNSLINGASSDGFKLTQSSLGWVESAMSDVTKRLSVLLSSTSLRLFNRLKFPFPGHVLVHGPRGSGKTALTRASAKYFEDHKDILAHVIYIDCSKLALGKAKEMRQAIEDCIAEALLHSPAIIIFDDLDSIISVSSDPQVSQSSSSDSLVRYLVDIMDEYKDKAWNACGYGPVALMASAQSLQSLPQDLTSSGRFDFHIELHALAVPERKALLKHQVDEHELQCSEEVLSEIASKCEGYDAYDLEILVDRAVQAAASRFVLRSNASLNSVRQSLVMEDFLKAMHGFLPVAMRDLRKYAPDDKDGGWEDVGGLNEAVTIIKETLELPSKYPNIFTRAPVRLRSNILLYGPPGCGKTHIVRAAAAACSLRFISVKGPELLNKYIGSSEQSVRDFFAKAVAAAPCLLFFDEFDSIAPQRGTHSAGVSDRVVNQFLTELDGVETLTGVFVFAATSKPQLIDAALLRPGRFDRLVFCDFPRWDERLEILKVHSKTVSLASDASLEDIASLTEGFTGADLAAILTDAGLAAVHELLDSQETGVPESEPCISKELLMSVARKARPSTPADEKRRYDREFGEFVSSRKSISTKARESKGKKVTLA